MFQAISLCSTRLNCKAHLSCISCVWDMNNGPYHPHGASSIHFNNNSTHNQPSSPSTSSHLDVDEDYAGDIWEELEVVLWAQETLLDQENTEQSPILGTPRMIFDSPTSVEELDNHTQRNPTLQQHSAPMHCSSSPHPTLPLPPISLTEALSSVARVHHRAGSLCHQIRSRTWVNHVPGYMVKSLVQLVTCSGKCLFWCPGMSITWLYWHTYLTYGKITQRRRPQPITA
jgi:hypothetical protein